MLHALSAVLIWVTCMLLVVVFNRGASDRHDRKLREIENRKQSIRWPATR